MGLFNRYRVPGWEKPWLIQQLNEPRGMAATPFSFGAGGGRFTQEALELLKDVLSFQYMGASEYEWGAVPEGFQNLVTYGNKKKLIKGQIELVEPSNTAFYLCAKPHEDQVRQFIQDNYLEKPTISVRDKTLFRYSMTEDQSDRSSIPVGWIELENPFMFFKSEEMYEKMSDLLKAK